MSLLIAISEIIDRNLDLPPKHGLLTGPPWTIRRISRKIPASHEMLMLDQDSLYVNFRVIRAVGCTVALLWQQLLYMLPCDSRAPKQTRREYEEALEASSHWP